MATNGSSTMVEGTESSLERIKRQLTSGSGRCLLQGPLLKRSETLRKWNERWVILDPTTGKMEYKTRRNEAVVRGTIVFDSNSTITMSPINFHGLPKYDGCCFYIATPQKKDYFLCAETPGAAKAWVSTLHATQLVLRAHRDAVNNLTGNGSTKFGTVATVVAAANSTAMEASKEIEAAMKISMRAALGLVTNKPNEDYLDDLTVMKETLRVKDEELQQLAKNIRARDSTIKEIADKLTETAEAAEAAASAARAMDEARRIACEEIQHLTKDAEKNLEISQLKLSELEEKVLVLSKEKEMLLKQRDSALQEGNLWRSELAKAREQAVMLEAAVVRAEERAKVIEANAEDKIKDASEKAVAAVREKEDLLALMTLLQSQVDRFQSNPKQICDERSESCSVTDDVDKACLSDSGSVPVSDGTAVQLAEDGVEIHSIGDVEWASFRSSNARIADVREISPENEESSLDITVVSSTADGP
ncbi:switch-associated protein 70-like [Zingiber officinale]|uniref:PH domain-containing protein n=1 Tax=Zingiber officinale TaxID=94328 RepID=A0A8J5LWD6_ZINOF|nr:switch-associated protein 70-like [Zingiber officinale]KAG6537933.1 hypothetical protein ZIOFF_003036 [Zingiber officinale]